MQRYNAQWLRPATCLGSACYKKFYFDQTSIKNFYNCYQKLWFSSSCSAWFISNKTIVYEFGLFKNYLDFLFLSCCRFWSPKEILITCQNPVFLLLSRKTYLQSSKKLFSNVVIRNLFNNPDIILCFKFLFSEILKIVEQQYKLNGKTSLNVGLFLLVTSLREASVSTGDFGTSIYLTLKLWCVALFKP